MIRYILADLRRSMRRIPRLIVLALVYGIISIAFVEIFKSGAKVAFLLILYEHYVVGYFPLVIGLLELAVILSDDFRAKTMQSAIGMGISRRQVVITKLCDMAILMFLDLLLLGLIVVMAGGIWNMGLSGAILGQFAATLFVAWLKSVAYASLALILAFYAQNALFAVLVHILLASGLAQKGLQMALSLKALAPLHLERFLLTTKADAFYTQALLGSFDAGSLAIVILYIALGIFVASYLFADVELEL